MSLRSLAVAALLAAAALSPAASAEPANELVFEASRSAWTEFELSRPLQVRQPVPRVEGGGRVAGFVLEHVDEERRANARIVFVGLAPITKAPVPLSYAGQLPAGRYRLVVFADRPLRVAIPVNEPGLVVRPTRPVSTLVRTASSKAAEGATATAARAAGALPASAAGFLFSRVDGNGVDQFRICATRAQNCPATIGFVPPSPLPYLESPVAVPHFNNGGVTVVGVAAEPQARDALATLDGVRRGTTTLLLGSLSYRLR